jgi:hypothetical protein
VPGGISSRCKVSLLAIDRLWQRQKVRPFPQLRKGRQTGPPPSLAGLRRFPAAIPVRTARKDSFWGASVRRTACFSFGKIEFRGRNLRSTCGLSLERRRSTCLPASHSRPGCYENFAQRSRNSGRKVSLPTEAPVLRAGLLFACLAIAWWDSRLGSPRGRGPRQKAQAGSGAERPARYRAQPGRSDSTCA